MSFSLRPYQQDLVDRTVSAFKQRETPLIVLPTGGGKTVVIAELVRLILNTNRRILLTAHRVEIVEQIAAAIEQHTNIKPGLAISGIATGWERHQVVVGMVPTLIRRLDSIPQGWALIEDECHHAIASSWKKLRDSLQPDTRIGLTATPITPSGGGLGPAGFTQLIEGPTLQQLIDLGALVPPLYLAAPPQQSIDTTGCRVIGGDYRVDDLEQRLDGRKLAADALALYREHAPGTKAIAACLSCSHADAVAQQFNRAGIKAAFIHGKLPAAQRDSLIAQFRSGAVRLIAQVSVVDEGFDLPDAETLLMLRPTRSLRCHRQLVGRVLRPAPGKTKAIVIDAGAAYADCGLPTDVVAWTLEGADHKPRPTQRLASGEIREHPQAELILQQQIRLEQITAQQAAASRLERAQENLRTVLSMFRHGRLSRGAVFSTIAKHPRSLQDMELVARTLGYSTAWARDRWLKQNQQLRHRNIDPAPEQWPAPEPVYNAPLVGAAAPLAEVWAKALEVCELPSTRMLLRNQAQLQSIQNDRAVVRVSRSWCDMLQRRQEPIDHCLSQALGRKIQAQLVPS